jgi:hypothetical protein
MTPEKVAHRRADAIQSLTKGIGKAARAKGVKIAPFPQLVRHLDDDHRLLAVLEWMRHSLVAIGMEDLSDEHSHVGQALQPPAPPQTPTEPPVDQTVPPPVDQTIEPLKTADLEKLTKEKLIALITHRGIKDISEKNTKAEIIAALTGG